ncbi:MAG: glycosyl transferase [Dysgonamonadaceae bacterium]|jgi:mannosyltransferase OCH1-like enzyme|nr:glycosyl transferase [Dysgonamonadaceae bacterium]
MLTYNTNTAILLLIFNRLDTTQKVFEKIRSAKPKRLYVAADGPRDADEAQKCEIVRNTIINQIDWECSLKTLFRDKNWGCREGVTQAISWFFENEIEGIILEDDCLPSDSFFGFCSQLLEKYRYDERIGHISGSNDQCGNKRGDGTYYFSALTGVWGWAGWRRVWKDYDIEMKSYPLFEQFNYLEKMPSHAPFWAYWRHKFKTHYENKSFNSWDFQYAYLNLINNRLCINPNVNLTSNIGCSSAEAAHSDPNNPASNRKLEELDEMRHPTFIIPDIIADINAQNFEFTLPVLKSSSFDSILFLEERLVEATKKIHKYSGIIKIPKIIHQIWINENELPEAISEMAKTWIVNHPDWEYRLWDKRAIKALLINEFPEYLPCYESFKYDMQRWHSAKYFILLHLGGLYVDVHSECLAPIDLLLGNASCCMGMEPESETMEYNKQKVIGNAFMACVPGHAYLKMIVEDIRVNFHKKFSAIPFFQIMESTGSFLTTRVYGQYGEKDDITLIPAELVTPLTLQEIKMILHREVTQEIEKKVEKAFVIHYYMRARKV